MLLRAFRPSGPRPCGFAPPSRWRDRAGFSPASSLHGRRSTGSITGDLTFRTGVHEAETVSFRPEPVLPAYANGPGRAVRVQCGTPACRPVLLPRDPPGPTTTLPYACGREARPPRCARWTTRWPAEQLLRGLGLRATTLTTKIAALVRDAGAFSGLDPGCLGVRAGNVKPTWPLQRSRWNCPVLPLRRPGRPRVRGIVRPCRRRPPRGAAVRRPRRRCSLAGHPQSCHVR